MSEEAASSNSFWEMLRWDGGLPLIGLVSRGVLALLFGNAAAGAITVILITPFLAMIRTQFANRQIQRLGIKRVYGRQICIAGAIVSLMLCEILAVIVLSDPIAPSSFWLIAGALYVVYVLLIAIALRSPRKTKPVDEYADYWSVRPIDK